MEYIDACIRCSERAQYSARTVVFRTLRATIIGATALLACWPSWGQTGIGGLSTLPTAEQVINRNQDPFAGSIPQGQAKGEVLDLTVEDALDRGLKYNLGLYLAARVTEQSSAARLRALSDLLPVVNGSFSESEQRLNLKQ